MRVILSIIFFIGSILWLPPTYSATIQERDQVINDVMYICNYYKRDCQLYINRDTNIVAVTNFNKITISQGTVNTFPKDELRAVLFHELSHLLLNHSARGINYRETNARLGTPLSTEQQSRLRHKFELEADRLAVQLLAELNKPLVLDDALLRISIGQDRAKDRFSHPSINKRIKYIRKQEIKSLLGM